ncbi:hypothetical protein [Deefgea sp. CFH1-16]
MAWQKRISTINAPGLLAYLRRAEERGAIETARKLAAPTLFV